jgi:hypothetical protein
MGVAMDKERVDAAVARRQGANEAVAAIPTQNGRKRIAASASMAELCQSQAGETGGEEGRSAAVPLSSQEVAETELKLYLGMNLAEVDGTFEKLPAEKVLSFWRIHSWRFPLLSKVARNILGKPVSAAGIERDWSDAALVVPPRRNRLDSACFEMIMTVHENYKQIPHLKDIPAMSPTEAKAAMPKRFTGTEYLQTSLLSCGDEPAAALDPEGEDVDVISL